MLQQRREHARAEERNEGELDEGEKTTLQCRMWRREEESSAHLEDRKGGPTPLFPSPATASACGKLSLGQGTVGSSRADGPMRPGGGCGRFYRAVKGGAEVDIVVWIRPRLRPRRLAIASGRYRQLNIGWRVALGSVPWTGGPTTAKSDRNG